MTQEEILKQNQGVILGQRETDYVGGTLPYQVRLESGDWRPFKPLNEKQRPNAVDVMACVTFSGLNSLEFQNIQQGNQEINFSDRFTAKDSGTTTQGNYLYKVADSLREGVVLESEYPAPDNFTWDSYYSTIPNDVYVKRKKYGVQYEWINKSDLAYHLKHAPIQIIITNTSPNHAVLAVYKEGDTVYYFDSYDPFIKTININDIYPSALKIVGEFQMNEFVETINNKGKVGIVVYADTVENYKFMCKQYKVDPKVQADGSIQTDISIN